MLSGTIIIFHCQNCGEPNEGKVPMVKVRALNEARNALRQIVEYDELPRGGPTIKAMRAIARKGLEGAA